MDGGEPADIWTSEFMRKERLLQEPVKEHEAVIRSENIITDLKQV